MEDRTTRPSRANAPPPALGGDDPALGLSILLADLAEAEDHAARAFASTLGLVAGEVAVRWHDPLPPADGAAGQPVTHMPVFDARYPVNRGGGQPDPGWNEAWFEWSFGISELRAARPGEVAFAAGAATPPRRANLNDARWLAEQRSRGFERVPNPRLGAEQLLRWLDVDRVLASSEPAGQADLVADWVVATFEALAASPPPAPDAARATRGRPGRRGHQPG